MCLHPHFSARYCQKNIFNRYRIFFCDFQRLSAIGKGTGSHVTQPPSLPGLEREGHYKQTNYNTATNAIHTNDLIFDPEIKRRGVGACMSSALPSKSQRWMTVQTNELRYNTLQTQYKRMTRITTPKSEGGSDITSISTFQTVFCSSSAGTCDGQFSFTAFCGVSFERII